MEEYTIPTEIYKETPLNLTDLEEFYESYKKEPTPDFGDQETPRDQPQ